MTFPLGSGLTIKGLGMTAKFVDIDGHIMEPANLWLDYIEPEYRAHALRISEDEDGLEYLNVTGRSRTSGVGARWGPWELSGRT